MASTETSSVGGVVNKLGGAIVSLWVQCRAESLSPPTRGRRGRGHRLPGNVPFAILRRIHPPMKIDTIHPHHVALPPIYPGGTPYGENAPCHSPLCLMPSG